MKEQLGEYVTLQKDQDQFWKFLEMQLIRGKNVGFLKKET